MPDVIASCLRFSVVAASAAVLVAMSEWTIRDVVTPFVFMPLQGLVWFLLCASCLWAIVVAIRFRRCRMPYPLGVGLVSCVVAFVPWTDLWLNANEALNKSGRERGRA